MILKLKHLFDEHYEQSFKYIIVGVACFAVDFAMLFVFLKFTKINYLIASAMSYTIGVILNYFSSIIWIFKKRALKNNWQKEFYSFLIIEFSALIFMTCALFIISGMFHINVMIAKVIANVISAVYNYIVKYKFLFAKNGNENEVLS